MGRKLLALLAGALVPVLFASTPATAAWEIGFLVRDDRSEGELSSWDDAVGAFAGWSRQLAPGLEIAPRLAARVSWFDDYHPPVHEFLNETVVRVIEAGDLYAAEGSVALRAVWGEGVIRTVGVSGGMMVANLPRVKYEAVHGNGIWPPIWTRSVRTAPETGRAVAKAFLGPSAGIRFRHAGGGPGVGFEFSFGMLTDRESHWIQLVSLIELR
jgi:hypothetical protein